MNIDFVLISSKWTYSFKLDNIENGKSYVIKDKVFSNSTILSNVDIEGNPVMDNCAYKFPKGWKEGDTPLRYSDLVLNKDGLLAKR